MAETVEQQTELEKEIERYKSKGYNIVLPTEQIFQLSPLQRIHFEILHIDTDPTHNEIYQVFGGGGTPDEDDDSTASSKPKSGGRYGLGKGAVDKFANAVGLIWVPEHCHRMDDGQNPNLALFQACGIIKKPDGSFITVTQTYELDVTIREAELKLKYEHKTKRDGTPYYTKNDIAYRVQKEGLRLRRFKTSLAESGAQTRVIKKILALKSWYTLEELKKPFAVPKVSLDINYLLANPDTRAQAIRQAIGAENAIFGARMLPSGEKEQIETASFVDLGASKVTPEPLNPPQPEQTNDPLLQPTTVKQEEKKTETKEPDTHTIKIFKTAQDLIDHYGPLPIDQQRKELQNLLTIRKLVLPKGNTPENIPAERLLDALWYYQNQPIKSMTPA